MKTRWLVRADIPTVLAISELSFDIPYPESYYQEQLRQRNCIGMGVEDDKGVVRGFLIYKYFRSSFEIEQIAVSPSSRGKGLGSTLLNFMKAKCEKGSRDLLRIKVPADNLAFQLWLKSHRFKATRVIQEPGRELYNFVWGRSALGAVVQDMEGDEDCEGK